MHYRHSSTMTSMLQFQILSISECDRVNKSKWIDRECMVLLNGRTLTGTQIVVACHGFRPSFKVRAEDANRVLGYLSNMNGVTYEDRYLFQFCGFATEASPFDEVSFKCVKDFVTARKCVRSAGVALYDSSLPPAMQMLMRRSLTPCQWVQIPTSIDPSDSCALLDASWLDVRACQDPPQTLAPFTIMAFDIECHSSHGDFPCAVKSYDRTARELSAIDDGSLADEAVVERELAMAFTGESKRLSKIFTKRAATPSEGALRKAATAIARSGHMTQDRVSEAPIVRSGSFVVTRDARPVWTTEAILRALRTSGLPEVQGDPVIQIGASHRNVLEGKIHNAIFVLGECDPVPDTTVYTFGDEVSMIRAFLRHVQDVSPEMLTGYNVMGFDFEYLIRRAEQNGLNIESETSVDPSLYLAASFAKLSNEHYFDIRPRLVVTRQTADRNDTYLSMCGRVTFDLMHVVQRDHSLTSYKLDAVAQHFTGERKDDISPAQIFASHGGTPADRAAVAKYCVQDCRLVLSLIEKLNAVQNAIGMADVCGVPVSWIFLRGQGCKILSLVSRQCMNDGFAVPEMAEESLKVEYEGAMVLEPETGAYIERPVVVLDFSSLYPSSMISHNISHDTMVRNPSAGGVAVGETLRFDLALWRKDASGEAIEPPLRSGGIEVGFVDPSVREGVLPRILKRLLAQRKRVRKQMQGEPDAFKRSTLDGLQLAYKTTANSLYGQLGAPTSPIFMPELAAATTAVGRLMLGKLRAFIETEAVGGHVVYGDSDSCFMVFPRECEAPCARDRLTRSIEAAKRCSDEFRKTIKAPHDAEYEKTFWPFILLSKKRYVGNMYTEVDRPCKRASMGIVLKRRDNAPIVKHVYGGIIDRVMEGDIAAATAFARDELIKLAKGEIDRSMLVITKTLRAESAYVDPSKIAHAVLAKRMNAREPGSAPNIGDRIPYVYVVAPKDTLQGERIEHADYVDRTDKRVDFSHYLTNQLTNPVMQLMSAIAPAMPGSRVTDKSSTKEIEKEVHRLVFRPACAASLTTQKGLQDIRGFFSRE
jgi:DNA polymerase elongation subunit (family B)